MSATQQELDDLLEHLIALTDLPGPDAQRDRLARLVLLLAERVGDPASVRAAIDEAMRVEARPLVFAIA